MTEFTADQLDKMSRLHVGTGVFARVFLPSGTRLLHNGLGRKVIGAETWEGVSNPFGGALVEIGEIEEPRFGHAPAIDVTISGNAREFLKQMWDDRFDIEGVRCDVYTYDEDAETGEEMIPLTRLFPGRLTALRFRFVGAAIRYMGVRIVSVFEGLNFPATDAQWSPAGQRARFPGDKGLDLVNAKIVEDFKA